MVNYTYLLRFLIGLAIVLVYTFAAFEYTSFPEPILMNSLGDYYTPWEVELPPIPAPEEKPIPITHQHRKMPPIYKEFSHEELGEALKDIIAEEEEEECAPLDNATSCNWQPQEGVLSNISEDNGQPVGGMKAFYAFIKNETKYPKEAKEAGAEGKVFISFVVKKDGTLRCIDIIRGVHPALDAEALRVMLLSPKWLPAHRCGQAIESRWTYPFNFRLKDNKDN